MPGFGNSLIRKCLVKLHRNVGGGSDCLFPVNPFPHKGYRHLSFEDCRKCNFCISDNPVFPNRLNRLKTPDIRALPASTDHIPCFLLTDKMDPAMCGYKISVGDSCINPLRKPLKPFGHKRFGMFCYRICFLNYRKYKFLYFR
jgi:hypothetical protein